MHFFAHYVFLIYSLSVKAQSKCVQNVTTRESTFLKRTKSCDFNLQLSAILCNSFSHIKARLVRRNPLKRIKRTPRGSAVVEDARACPVTNDREHWATEWLEFANVKNTLLKPQNKHKMLIKNVIAY